MLAAVTSGAGSEVKQLKKVASVLQESQRALSRTNALTFADLVAIGGAEAFEGIGGPVLSVKFGRTGCKHAARGGAASGETTKTKLGGDGVLPIDWNNPSLARCSRRLARGRPTETASAPACSAGRRAPRRFAVTR